MAPRFELGINPVISEIDPVKIVRQGADVFIGTDLQLHREIIEEMKTEGIAVDPSSPGFDAGSILDDGTEILLFDHSRQFGVGDNAEERREDTVKVLKELVGDQREVRADFI